MSQLDEKSDALEHESLALLEEQVETLRRQMGLRERYNEELREESMRMRNAASAVRKRYSKLVSSRVVVAWIRLRRLVGKPVEVLDVPMPVSVFDDDSAPEAVSAAFFEVDRRSTLEAELADLRRANIRAYDESMRLEAEIRAYYDFAQRYCKSYKKIRASKILRLWARARKSLTGKGVPSQIKMPAPKVFAPCHNPENQDMVDELTRALKSGNGHRAQSYFREKDIVVGYLGDELNYLAFRDACALRCLTPENYEREIEGGELSLILCFSLWEGVTQDGRRSDCFRGKAGLEAVQTILVAAKEKGVPVVFVSTEDPVSYDRYLPLAQTADYVFTSAAESVERYRRDTACSFVEPLLFGINPLLHNPIGFARRRRRSVGDSVNVSFAGSWYGGFAKRCASMRLLTDGVVASSRGRLYIMDRASSNSPDRQFPPEYRPYMIPGYPASEVGEAQKSFDFAINLNTVTDSATMCARRVYEVQALGSLMLTNYTYSVSRSFPGMFTVLRSDEVNRILGGYSDDELLSLQLEGIRDVYSGHTTFDRLNQVFDAVGMGESFPVRSVYLVFDEVTDEAREYFDRQICPGKRILPASEAASADDGFMIRMPGSGLPASPVHLLDMVNAFKFTDADYVLYVDGFDGAYEYCSGTPSSEGALFDLSKLDARRILDACVSDDLRGFGILAPRWGRDTSDDQKELAVIVPVCNNGKYLWKRCFRSLLRSTAFGRMHIYLIDDASTDGMTPMIVRWIAETFDNVEPFFFEDGGSSGASRARGKGLELCSEPFVAFLDPKDEAIGDGFAQLLEDLASYNVDCAFGSVLEVVSEEPHVSELRYCDVEGVVGHGSFASVADGLEERDMQGCVIRRSAIDDSRIGSRGAGQVDSFCGLAACVSKAYCRKLPVYARYADLPE